MRFSVLLLAASCLLSVAPGQWLETVIDQSDSLCLMDWPAATAYVPTTNAIYVSGDGTMVIDAATEEKVAWLPIAAWASFYNPVNGLLYLGGDSIHVLDPTTNSVVAEIPLAVPGEQSQVFAFDSTRNRLYSAGDGRDTVFVIDCDANTVLARVPTGEAPYALCYASAADKVYCANLGSDDITVIDAGSNGVVATIPGDWVTYHPLNHSPVNNRLYYTTVDRGMLVIDCASDVVVDSVYGRYILWRGWYNPARNTIHALDGDGWGCAVIDCSADSLITTFPVEGGEFVTTCFDPVNQKFYYTDMDYRIGVVDCVGDSGLSCLLVGPIDWHAPLCVNPEANKVYCGNNDWSSVSVVDGATGRVSNVVQLSSNFMPKSLCWIPDRDLVYCGNKSGVISVIDGRTNEVLRLLPGGLGPWEMVFLPAEHKVYALNLSGFDMQVLSAVSDSLLAEVHRGYGLAPPLVSMPAGKVYCIDDYPQGHGDVIVFDPTADTIVSELNTGLDAKLLVGNPDRDELYAANRGSGASVVVIDAQSDTLSGSIVLPAPPIALGLSRVSGRLYCLLDSGSMAVVDCGLRQVIETTAVPVPNQWTPMLWNPASDKMYYRARSDSLVVFSCRQGRVEAMLALAQPSPLLCDTIANKVYVSCNTGVAVVDGASNSLLTVIATDPAGHWAACWNPVERRVYVAGGRYTSQVAVIRDATGIAEGPGLALRQPTIVRGSLVLSRKLSAVGAALLDAAGRKVMELRPGANDVRHLSPGVYFVREGPSVVSHQPEAVSVHKVVVTK